MTENLSGAALDPEMNQDIQDKYLTFWTEQQLFGIPIADVVQIVGIQHITEIPDFPAYAKGIINLRGNIIPVIDMRSRFHKPEIDYNERTCIIVTSIQQHSVGLIVDAVDEVTDIPDKAIALPPKINQDAKDSFLTGIGNLDQKIILLLDTGKILSENEYELLTQETGF